MGESKISRRRWLELAGGTIVGLAVGGAAGYFSGAATAPTITQKVTETIPGPTVTKTVIVTPTPTPTPSPKPIKPELLIGGTLPLTGIVAPDGQRILKATELAVDKVNAEGGIDGMKLKLIMYDDGMDPTKVGSLYEKLITTDEVDILVSPYGAPMAFPALAACKKYDKIMIAAYVGSKSPAIEYGGKWMFMPLNQPKEKNYSVFWYKMFTDFLWDFDKWNYKPEFPRPTKIAVVNEDQLWGIEQHEMWRPLAEEQGWNIVVDEFVSLAATDFSDVLTKIKLAKPDVILAEFFWFRCVMILKQMAEQGVTANFIAMSESGTSYDWLDPVKGVGPKLGEGVLTVSFLPKGYHGGGADYLRDYYQKNYGIPPSAHEVVGYASIEIIRDAVKKAGSIDSDALRKVLLKEEFETCYTRVKFDAEGNNVYLEPTIGQWIGGKLEDVWPPERATAKPIYPYTGT